MSIVQTEYIEEAVASIGTVGNSYENGPDRLVVRTTASARIVSTVPGGNNAGITGTRWLFAVREPVP